MMKIERISFPGVSIVLAIIGCGFVLLSVYKVGYEERPSERAGSRLDVRGNTIMVVRVPHQTQFELLTIQADGQASRSPIPFNNAVDTQTYITLSAPELADLQILRTHWCRGQMTFGPVNANERSYDLATRCDGAGLKQTTVPVDRLPPILQTILTRLPALPVRP